MILDQGYRNVRQSFTGQSVTFVVCRICLLPVLLMLSLSLHAGSEGRVSVTFAYNAGQVELLKVYRPSALQEKAGGTQAGLANGLDDSPFQSMHENKEVVRALAGLSTGVAQHQLAHRLVNEVDAARVDWFDADGELLSTAVLDDPRLARVPGAPGHTDRRHSDQIVRPSGDFLLRGPALAATLNLYLPPLTQTTTSFPDSLQVAEEPPQSALEEINLWFSLL